VAKGVSGTTIKGWFQYKCERKTRYESIAAADLSAIPIIQDTRESQWAIKGTDFEASLVNQLSRQHKVLVPRKSSDAFAKLDDSLAHRFLRGEDTALYAAQMNVRPDTVPEFLKRVDDIEIRLNLPDLVRREQIGGRSVFSVIDVKATRKAKSFHKAQVAFYALLLTARLRELGIDAEVAEFAEIWRFPDTGAVDGKTWGVEAFNLRPYKRQVEQFCSTELPSILNAPVSREQDATFFHVYFKCEQCKFIPHCEKSVSPDLPAAVRNVSAVAGLSQQAKKSLLEAGIKTVSDLASSTSEKALGNNAGWTLTRRIDSLIARAKAISGNTILAGSESHSYLLPPRTDVSLYLSVDADPIDDQLATLGYLYCDKTQTRQIVRILPDSDSRAEAEVLVDVFTRLIEDLDAVDLHNQTASSEDQLRAHIYIYEPAEAEYLQQAVKRHLDNPKIRGGLINLVRLFPPEEVIPEPELRGMDHLPASSVRSTIEQLFALPVSVSHDLRQVSEVLAHAGKIKIAYQPTEPFRRPFSALLSIDIMRGLRERRKDALRISDVEADVSARLAATRAVTEWIFSEHELLLEKESTQMLRLRKKPFRLQQTFDPINLEDLDTLKALELLENRSGKLETLVRLSRSKAVRQQTGRTIGPLSLLPNEGNKGEMVFESGEDLLDTELSRDTFALILSDGEPDSVLEPSLWPSYKCQISRIRGRRITVSIDSSLNRNSNRLALLTKMSAAGNTNWWIDEVFLDFNTDRVDRFISFLGGA
jgi:predicted RecB family nuclease